MKKIIYFICISLILSSCVLESDNIQDEASNETLPQEISVNLEQESEEVNMNLDDSSSEEIDWYDKGREDLLSENYSDAIVSFSKVDESHDMYVDSLDARAIAYWKSGDLESAKENFAKAIEARPDYWEYYYNRANMYGENYFFEEAIVDLEKVLELNPGHEKSLMLMEYAKGQTNGN